ncbi:3-hydroxyacyl-CoA dehydrogenase family protein [Rhodococcus opacus]|uniref:3-hydroxyacyl-CoA dehydrogenase family protein n=1 Tax=Rhodococcus opacus TaxID=37919 RepID=UPI001C4881DE|nr:3-hydroxyacyl-CoA dehydrogenase family protein [Rhodococcus opacus]MBV6756676.1 3-hydroxyacyl-CoA dehydrogenase family protein [Rhodococcus opacus]
MAEFQKVAVLGYGTMGGGIAQVVAQAGIEVVVLDADPERLAHGGRSVREFLEEGVTRGKVSPEQLENTLARISTTTTVAELSDCDLVIEAVTEQHDVKARLFREVAEVVSQDTVIATNTSALSVSGLAMSVPRPERFAGLHFFNPAQLMGVVEVVRAEQTEDAVIARLSTFAREIGKEPLAVKDRPGFLINWLLMPYLNDVIQEFDNELASAEDIDVALKLGLGYKLGPMELLDMIGLDVHNHATRAAYDATLDPAFAPPPLLQTMVAANRLGRKTGIGFRTEESHA